MHRVFIDYRSAFNTNIPDILIHITSSHTRRWLPSLLHAESSFVHCIPTTSPPPILLTVIKFADDTTMVRLISGDDTTNRDGMLQLITWCIATDEHQKNQEGNNRFQKEGVDHDPININGDCIEWVPSFKFQ